MILDYKIWNYAACVFGPSGAQGKRAESLLCCASSFCHTPQVCDPRTPIHWESHRLAPQQAPTVIQKVIAVFVLQLQAKLGSYAVLK